MSTHTETHTCGGVGLLRALWPWRVRWAACPGAVGGRVVIEEGGAVLIN